MNEAKGIAFTNFDYPVGNRTYRISVTVRDGGRQEAEDSLLALLEIINEVVDPALVETMLKDIPEIDPDGISEDRVTGNYLGLLDYAPKSSELEPGQTYELAVDQYTLKDGEIQFWKGGGQYPAHTHKLNDVGVKKMAELFTVDWDKHFPKGEYQPIKGGTLIIKIEGSQKLTSKGNPYKNLVGKRRPQ